MAKHFNLGVINSSGQSVVLEQEHRKKNSEFIPGRRGVCMSGVGDGNEGVECPWHPG